MPAKYVDIPAIVQVIGSIYLNPSVLDQTEKYHFNEEDFPEEFHKILFGTIFNLHALGAKEITPNAIIDYLEQRPKKLAVYKTNNGEEYLQKVRESAQPAAFNYYYSRMKKMTLLRMYQAAGMDLRWLYDTDNILDLKKKQQQEDWLDNTPIEEIADQIDKKITDIRLRYVDNTEDVAVDAGTGIKEFLERLKDTPDVGYPLFGNLINTITRGARLKKFYLRSSPTNVGKSRTMIADVCTIGCGELYQNGQWVQITPPMPALYITTEQELDEVQTMMLAFISDVEEDKILSCQYTDDEWNRVQKAADILIHSPIYVREMHDFSLEDIETCIKYEIQEHGIHYVFHDYLHSSMKILSEVSSKAGVKGLREDNVLFMIAVKLKELCNKYNLFIFTSTQLNASYQTAEILDQNLLRGAKAVGDKIDLGMIMLETSQEDLDALKPILEQGGFDPPAIKIAVYKNRRGKYRNILLWCRARRGVCKIEPMFCTDYNYELMQLEDTIIKVRPLGR